MDIGKAIKGQYHAGLRMLTECVEKCPEDMWLSGTYPRYFWRIALHGAFFTQLYLGQSEEDFKPWPSRCPGVHTEMWNSAAYMEPYELPSGAEVFTRNEMLDYISYIRSIVDTTVDGLDMETQYSGFTWYGNVGKLSHELMNISHLHYHVGQLSERLMANGVEIGWWPKGE